MTPVLTSASDRFFTTKPGFVKPPVLRQKNIFKQTLTILNEKERKQFGLLTLSDFLINVVDIFSLALLLWIIQFYIQPGKSAFLPFLPHWLLDKHSIAFIVIFFFIFSAKNLTAFFIARKQNGFIGDVAVRLSKNNLTGYQNSDFQEFVNVDSSIHVRKIAYQPFDFCQYMLSGIQLIITQASLIIITIVAIILFNAKLFLLLLFILLPPVIGVFYFIKRKLTKAKFQIKLSNQKSFQYLMDALKGFVEGNIYNRNNFFLQRFVSDRKKFSFHLFDSIALQTLPSRLIEIFAVMGLFVLIINAKWNGNNDSGTLITIGAFMAAAYKIIPGIVKIVNTASQIKAYEFSLSDISNIENSVQKEAEVSGPIQSLKFSNIYFQYNDLPIIKNLSFSVQPGDFVGIAGRSGKGKTTILNLLLGFLAPHNGEIFINNAPVHKDAIKDYWTDISYVRQQSFFIHDTVLRNITLEEETYDDQKLQYAIKLSGLDDLIQDSSEGIHKIITENGKNISGGQQQRIALARAIYKNANLILLDEPFNELDEVSELSILHHFKKMCSDGKMVVMITHNKKALSFCNKIISLDEQ